MVWTDARTLQRMRAVRGLKVVLPFLVAAAIGSGLGVLVVEVRGDPAADLQVATP